ncbi:MAG: hypothetical protein QOJ92_2974 [Frankiales bacterium]|jgi:uncharacterized membrane-anchored protein|nr:hypothetical protein [Frankiales bacterium]MDX6275764.1 hypothetical protein [Frankiales bacterium]
MTDSRAVSRPTAATMLSKVPEVTIYFWIIKVLCTTVGETFSDNLASQFNLGTAKLAMIFGVLLAVVLAFQFRARRYVPGIYWLAVVLLSVEGTLITDNLTDVQNVALSTTTILFSILLALTFIGWYVSEKTLSIHSIITTRREAWYWTAILFTFALGTASGDYLSEKLNTYSNAVLVFSAAIAVITLLHFTVGTRHGQSRRVESNAVLAFWAAYILTRPLGASIGDFLSLKNPEDNPHAGGIGLGTTVTSAIFLSAILLLVIYLSITRRDEIEIDPATGDVIHEAGVGYDHRPGHEHHHGHEYAEHHRADEE